MKTLTQLFDEIGTDNGCRDLFDGRSGVKMIDDNGVPDSPDDYTVLRQYEFGDETFAAVKGPSGDIDAVDFIDGCRLYRSELDSAKKLIFWIRDCHPSVVETTFRMVGFTDSTYENGESEVGYTGDFVDSILAANEVGCGDNGMASGYEIREYINDLFVSAHSCD